LDQQKAAEVYNNGMWPGIKRVLPVGERGREEENKVEYGLKRKKKRQDKGVKHS